MIDEKAMTEIGKVVVYFSWLEFNYKTFFQHLVGIEEQAWKIITAEMRFSELLNLFKTIFKAKYKKDPIVLKKVSELIDTSLQLNSKRNNLIHCYWMANSGEKPNEYLVFRLKKDISKLEDIEQLLGGHRIFYSIDELKKLSEDIKQNYLDFHKVVPDIPVILSQGLNDISRYKKYNDNKGK